MGNSRTIAGLGAAGAIVGLLSGMPAAKAQDATAFQLNPAHTGSVSMPGFKPPLAVLWTRKLKGSGFSYPLIVDGMVYISIGGYDHEDQKGTDFYALDAATGNIKWKKKIDNAQHDPHLDTRSTATYDNGQIYVLDAYNVLTSYDAKTGKVRWSQLEGQYDLLNGGSPPAALDGGLYISSQRINEGNGRVRWYGIVDGGDLTAPAIGGGGMYEAFACVYYKFRLTDGVKLWQHGDSCGGGGSVPQFLGNQVFVREPLGFAPNLVLDAGSGATLGSFPRFTNIPALYEDEGSRFMIAPNGDSLIRYDVTNPAAIVSAWSTSLDKHSITTAPLVVNGYAIAGTFEKHGLYMLSPQGEIAWRTELSAPATHTNERGGSGALAGLAAGDGILVVPTQREKNLVQTLYAFVPQ